MKKAALLLLLVLILLTPSITSAATPVSSTTHVYLNGKELTSIDSNGQRLYYHQDYLGSTRIITNASGELVSRVDYAPFGSELVDTTKTKYTFTGKEQDNTGLQYFVARYYDSSTGRFMSVDPIYSSAISPYEYANDNPLKFVDPNGKASVAVADKTYVTLQGGNYFDLGKYNKKLNTVVLYNPTDKYLDNPNDIPSKPIKFIDKDTNDFLQSFGIIMNIPPITYPIREKMAKSVVFNGINPLYRKTTTKGFTTTQEFIDALSDSSTGKIDLLYIYSHGDRNGIISDSKEIIYYGFMSKGEYKSTYSITADSLSSVDEDTRNRIREKFNLGAVCILASCETGTRNFAGDLSRFLGIDVLASSSSVLEGESIIGSYRYYTSKSFSQITGKLP